MSDTTPFWVTEDQSDKGLRYGYLATEVLFSTQTEFQKLDVVDTRFFGKMLLLDGLVMTTELDEFIYHEMIAHIPLLAHPNPRDVLVIGGGDGGTVREVLKHPTVESVTLCEIDGGVIEASKQWLPTIAGALADPRVTLAVEDGIHFIAGKTEAYDVVIVDSTDPIGPGEVLFTVDFYNQVSKALRSNGVFSCQSESPLACAKEFNMIVNRLKQVFPLAVPYVATVPTYPGGYWSWTFASKNGAGPLNHTNEEVAVVLEQHTRFFNRQVHRAVFSLPNFVRQAIEGNYLRAGDLTAGAPKPC